VRNLNIQFAANIVLKAERKDLFIIMVRTNRYRRWGRPANPLTKKKKVCYTPREEKIPKNV